MSEDIEWDDVSEPQVKFTRDPSKVRKLWMVPDDEPQIKIAVWADEIIVDCGDRRLELHPIEGGLKSSRVTDTTCERMDSVNVDDFRWLVGNEQPMP